MSTQCRIGGIIDTLDERQEAHIEGFLLGQHFGLAAELLARHSEESVRWQEVRKHIINRTCGCWGAEARIDLRPRRMVVGGTGPSVASVQLGDAGLDVQAREVYDTLLERADTAKSSIDKAVREVSAARIMDWGDPIGYFAGGRQWVCEATGISSSKWKTLGQYLRAHQMIAQVGRGYGTGYLLYPGLD